MLFDFKSPNNKIMKKLILSFLSLMSVSVFAQSLSADHAAYYFSNPGETCTAHFDVVNVTDQDVEIIVTRIMNPNDAITSTFCWGETCYTPTTNVSTNSIVIPAGESFDGFSGYIYSMGEEVSYVINYCFSSVNDPTDKVCTDVTFTSLSQYVGVEEFDINSSVYPNPANEVLYIDYTNTTPAAFVLYDMLGNKVYAQDLLSSKSLNLTAFEAGIYFYTFSVQGKETEVQKLIITH